MLTALVLALGTCGFERDPLAGLPGEIRGTLHGLVEAAPCAFPR